MGVEHLSTLKCISSDITRPTSWPPCRSAHSDMHVPKHPQRELPAIRANRLEALLHDLLLQQSLLKSFPALQNVQLQLLILHDSLLQPVWNPKNILLIKSNGSAPGLLCPAVSRSTAASVCGSVEPLSGQKAECKTPFSESDWMAKKLHRLSYSTLNADS